MGSYYYLVLLLFVVFVRVNLYPSYSLCVVSDETPLGPQDHPSVPNPGLGRKFPTETPGNR